MAKRKEPRVSVTIIWLPEDVQTLKPDWTLNKCAGWLERNGKWVESRSIELGWEVIDDLLGDEE